VCRTRGRLLCAALSVLGAVSLVVAAPAASARAGRAARDEPRTAASARQGGSGLRTPGSGTIAFVKNGTIYEAQDDGQNARAVAKPHGYVFSLAFSDGKLFYSLSGTPGLTKSCNLYITGRASPVARAARIDREVSPAGGALCSIAHDPAGGLFFTTSAYTFGSLVTYSLDVAAGSVHRVSYGYDIAPGPPGRPSLILEHLYHGPPQYGSYEMLCEGVVGQPGDFPPVPGLSKKADYGPAALSVDGSDLALGRDFNEVLVGPLGGHLRSIWRTPNTEESIVQLAWLPGDRSLLADVQEGHLNARGVTTTSNLETISVTGSQQVIEHDVGPAGFAAG